MKTILVTTDLSEESKSAFGPALGFAQSAKAKINLLAVIEDPAQAAFAYALEAPVHQAPDIYKQVLEKVEADLGGLARQHFSGVQCTAHTVEARGPVHQEILRFAKTQNADLIVIATHGRTGFSHLLIGSVTERLIREAHCPVLVIPSKKKIKD